MKKYYRRMFAALLVLAMLLALAACGGPAGGTTTAATAAATTAAAAQATTAAAAAATTAAAAEPDADQVYNLSISMLGASDNQIATYLAKELGPSPSDNFYMYNREQADNNYPNVTWEWNEWGWAEALDQKQRASITAGTPPTNIAGEAFIPSYINANILQEIPEWVLEDINPSFVATGADGKAYCIAYKTSTFMLFYNKDLVEQAGFDPEEPPATWEDWRTVSMAITELGAGSFWGGGIPSFPHNGGALRATPFFRQLGTDFGGMDEINLDDPKVQEVLKYIREMNENLPPGLGNGIDEGPLWNAFSDKPEEQNIGFVVDGSWRESSALRNNLNIGVAPLPLPEGGVPGNCLVGTVYIGVPVGVPAEETALFWDFYKNVCLSEPALMNFVGDNLVVPRQSMLDNSSLFEGEGKAAARIAIADLMSGTYTGQAAFVTNDGQIWEIINQQVLARTTMTNDPIETICAEAMVQIEALLR
ncbi:MAG: extracellular solute-binding protein [Oscillospiraceae bacterium]|nr:extracellular solute-binding protein [Oscillospiraceae bacterium]